MPTVLGRACSIGDLGVTCDRAKQRPRVRIMAAMEEFVSEPIEPQAGAFDRFGLPVLSSSDSHFPGEIGQVLSVLALEEPTFAELALAFRGQGGRGVRRA